MKYYKFLFFEQERIKQSINDTTILLYVRLNKTGSENIYYLQINGGSYLIEYILK